MKVNQIFKLKGVEYKVSQTYELTSDIILVYADRKHKRVSTLVIELLQKIRIRFFDMLYRTLSLVDDLLTVNNWMFRDRISFYTNKENKII
jgi:hypothetical protein